MNIRSLASLSALAFAVTSMASMPMAAQATQDAAQAKKKVKPKRWTPSLTPDGQPDLQGNWVNKSATPLERPKQLEGRQFLTDAEVAELKRRADRLFKNGHSDFPAGDDFFLAALANIEQYKRASSTCDSEHVEREFDNRTSLIVDPPDGRLPPYTPEGQRRQAANLAAILTENRPSGPEDLSNANRCITWGVPMPRPSSYTSYYQIVQAPGYVVVVMEAIHDARIIPLDGRPHLPPTIRTWNGDSLGRWEDKTLVVDTTNFSPKDNFMGSAENLHLVERFTRIAPDEIRYEITVNDPTTWTKPWTAILRLKLTLEKIYEFACHEGNFQVVEGILKAARAEEKW
jgi:hypothetical protein